MADATEDEQQVPHLWMRELVPMAVKSRVFLLRYGFSYDDLDTKLRSPMKIMKLLWVLKF